MSDKQQIAPCPFCGTIGEDYVNVIGFGSVRWVQCNECGSKGPTADSIKGSIECWNSAGNQLLVLEQNLFKYEAAISELCDAVTARFSTDNPTGEHTLRLFRAIDAARKALDLK